MTGELRLGPTLTVRFQRALWERPGAPPGSSGTLPLRWADDEIVLPLAADESVWLSLRADEPVALAVTVDGRDALTGEAAPDADAPPDRRPHVVVPERRSIDGLTGPDGGTEPLTGPAPGERRTIELRAWRLRGAAAQRWWTTSGQRRARNDFGADEVTPVLGGAGAPAPTAWTPDWDPDPIAIEVVTLLPPDP
jgi:hypothetical protein